jgi:hypothetical protein
MPCPVRKRFQGILTTALAGTTIDGYVTVGGYIQGSGREELWDLLSIYVKMTTNGGATAATWEFRIAEEALWTNDDVEERYTHIGVTVAGKIGETQSSFGLLDFKADADGRIHLRAAANAAAGAGTSHIWTYRMTFERREGV